MDMWLGESGLRREAEARGFPVTHAQFKSYRDSGLLPEPDADRRWPADLVHLLVRVRQLERVDGVRPISRRVLLIHREAVRFPIRPEKLREALCDVLPTITAPTRKMRRITKACVRMARALQGQELQAKSVALPRGWKLPERTKWDDVLKNVAPDLFAARIGVVFHLAHSVLPAYAGGTPDDVSDIPFEERVTLLAVREFATATAMSITAKAAVAEEEAAAADASEKEARRLLF